MSSPVIKAVPASEGTGDTPGFNHMGLSPSILRGIAAAGYEEPRPIQQSTIPEALDGRDILGLAQTGTGKTAAFAIPLLERLLASRASGGPRVLVVAPTRELATQISEEFRSLARHTSMKVATLFGGVSERPQIAALRDNPEVVVACPGRLLDLLQRRAVRLDRVEALVLDEADHMFDMGFLRDIQRILAALPGRRQNLLFSATMPKEIRLLADKVLRDPHVVELGHSKPVETVDHAIYPVDEKQKIPLLEKLLSQPEFASTIVFTRTKHRAKRLALKLGKVGHRVVALQGNMSQNARERALAGFKSRQFDVLVATDIAARGIDIEKVSHVINFDMPNTTDAYTHRIGRTGRSERKGQALTFVTAEDQPAVRAVERRIGSTIARRSAEGIESIAFSTATAGTARPRPRNSSGAGRPRSRAAGAGGAGRSSGAGRPGRRRGSSGRGRSQTGS